MKKGIPCNINQRKAGVILLIMHKVDFVAKNILCVGGGADFIMTNASIRQEDVTNINAYVSNNKPSKYTKQKLIELEGEIDKARIIGRDFNIKVANQ